MRLRDLNVRCLEEQQENEERLPLDHRHHQLENCLREQRHHLDPDHLAGQEQLDPR